MTNEQFEKVAKWQKKTFPEATALSKACHLSEEVEELMTEIALYNGPSKTKRLEYADCFLLLFGSAHSDGMSYEDICNCIEEKFEIVKKREWGTPDKNGVVHHLKN